jgi:hypothetical protein
MTPHTKAAANSSSRLGEIAIKHTSLLLQLVKGYHDTQHNDIQQTTLCYYAESHHAECRILLIVVLSVVMLRVIIQNVVVLSAVTPVQAKYMYILFIA